MGINRRNSPTLCHDRSLNRTFGQPTHYAVGLVCGQRESYECCGLVVPHPAYLIPSSDLSYFVPPGNTAVDKPCKNRGEHHPRCHPCQDHESRAFICCDANLTTVLVDGIYHLHNDSRLDARSDAKGKECQLAKPVSLRIHTLSDLKSKLTKSITAFRLSLNLPPDSKPKIAPMMARPANPMPMQ